MGPDAIRVCVEPSDVEPHLGRVIELADAHRSELGFLPRTVFEELALKGRLWVVMAGSEVCAYLALGGSRYTVRVVQLLVDDRYKGRGHATLLLGRLKEFAQSQHAQVICARVATDLPANSFWERQGFHVVDQMPGGKTSGRVINVRVFEVPSSSLLGTTEKVGGDWLRPRPSDPLFSTPSYSLDLNILFDALRERPGTKQARRLFSAAFGSELRLCVSGEFSAELTRTSLDTSSDTLLQFARSLPTLEDLSKSEMDRLVASLRSMVFPDRSPSGVHSKNDESDLRHLASSIHNRVHGFVTNEHAILRAAPAIRTQFGLEVLSPIELLGIDDEPSGQEQHIVVNRDSESIFVEKYQSIHRQLVDRLFGLLGIDDATSRSALDAGTSTRRRERLCLRQGDNIVGFASWNGCTPTLTSQLCYFFLDERTHGVEAAIDHVVGLLTAGALQHYFSRCDLWTALGQIATRATARQLGFADSTEGSSTLQCQRKFTFRGWTSNENWPAFKKGLSKMADAQLPDSCPSYRDLELSGLLLTHSHSNYKSVVGLFDFETKIGPFLLLAKDRPAVIVPIRDKLASELLPPISIQQPLFPKEASSRLERAYFGKPALASLVQKGSIVVFYISSADRGRGEAVGMARVTSVGTSTPEGILLKLARQGVLSISDIGAIGEANSKVAYFTFDTFLRFKSPVPYQQLCELGCVGGANLVTTQTLTYDKLMSLVGRSSA